MFYVTKEHVASSCLFFLHFALPFKHGFSRVYFGYVCFTCFSSSIINTILIVTCKTVKFATGYVALQVVCTLFALLHLSTLMCACETLTFFLFFLTLCQYNERTWCVLSRSASAVWISICDSCLSSENTF